MEDAVGLVLMHDLSNMRSEENLVQWANLLYENAYDHRKMTDPKMPVLYASDVEYSQPIPTLVVASHFDEYPQRARAESRLHKLRLQQNFYTVSLDCRKPLLNGSSENMVINKFFDAVIDADRAKQDGTGVGGFASYRRRRIN
uniref:Peptidase_S9 domain-containing protein n=1 Tax=Panagrellus redivivus TaxID=6233 RepID=A0A7E4V2Q8_PANRE